MGLSLPWNVRLHPDDPNALQGNFDALAAAVPSPTPVGTTLPSNPQNGQEYYYVADATNGVVWHLKYRAASSSSWKWEYVGGAPLYSYIATKQPRANTTFGDLTTVGPSITFPLTGDYDVQFGAHITQDSAGTYTAQIAVAFGPSAGPFTILPAPLVKFGGAIQFEQSSDMTLARVPNMTAGQVMKLQYKTDNGALQSSFEDRFIRVTPVRVG